MENKNAFPLEQSGSARGLYGCKDQLLINRMILEHGQSKHRNMSMAWIDYRKAFDSVPHNWKTKSLKLYDYRRVFDSVPNNWIIKSLELFKVSPIIVNFLRSNMLNWKATLFL